jgi:hypothetical protein
MEIDACFLSIEVDQPLAICIADDWSFYVNVIPLEKFFKDSWPEMGKEQAARYAVKFQEYANELRAFSET